MRSLTSTMLLGSLLVLVLAALAYAQPAIPAVPGMTPDLGPIVLVTGLMGLVGGTRGPRT